MDDEKKCPTCKRILPRSEFGKRRAGSGNLVSTSKCRECARAAANAAYDSTKAAAAYQRRKAEDPERLHQISSAAAAKRRGTPEHAERARDWRRRNPDKVSAYQRRYAADNRLARCEFEQRRRARKKRATIAPFTPEQLAARLSMFPGCWMCGGAKESIDHVKPLAVGGGHILANLRPACKSCNSRKRSIWPIKNEILSSAS